MKRILFLPIPHCMGSIDRTSSDAKIQLVLESKVRDYLAFAFVSPEGSHYDRAGHTNSPLKALSKAYLTNSLLTHSDLGGSPPIEGLILSLPEEHRATMTHDNTGLPLPSASRLEETKTQKLGPRNVVNRYIANLPVAIRHILNKVSLSDSFTDPLKLNIDDHGSIF